MHSTSLDRLFVFIMAGGSGERFWPSSRTATPKHLLKLLGDQTLLEQTVRRFEGVVPLNRIYILTNVAQVESTIAALPFLPSANIIAEPAKRDTAPAAALATGIALRQRPDALVALFPADAMIHDTATFRRQLTEAAGFVGINSSILTFSIMPTHASTGFGYLQLGSEIATEGTSRSSSSWSESSASKSANLPKLGADLFDTSTSFFLSSKTRCFWMRSKFFSSFCFDFKTSQWLTVCPDFLQYLQFCESKVGHTTTPLTPGSDLTKWFVYSDSGLPAAWQTEQNLETLRRDIIIK